MSENKGIGQNSTCHKKASQKAYKLNKQKDELNWPPTLTGIRTLQDMVEYWQGVEKGELPGEQTIYSLRLL